MQSMSRDMRNSVFSSSSARLRSTNCPIWLPIIDSWSSRSWSGSRISRLKNSSTPSTMPPSLIGKPKAPWSPSRAATGPRGKFVSRTTSSIQTGSPLRHTRPGSPTARSKCVWRVTASNSASATDGECQVSRQRIEVPEGSTVQTAPWS